MTRKLPWEECDDGGGLVTTPAKKTATTATPSRKVTTPSYASATRKPRTRKPLSDSSNRRPARSNGLLRDRSQSTSPPPQPLPEICMIEGLENDDKYRMVEDELFTVAGQFTAHLHAAEYQKLKAQIGTQNAETIKDISRPVVGSLTELARKRQEELLRKKKQREALRNAKKKAGVDNDSGDEMNMPWHGTSLQGLMDSPQKKEVPLMALSRADSGTRASTLFGGVMKPKNKRPMASLRRMQMEEETEDDSDDLGGPIRVPAKKEAARGGSLIERPVQAAKSAPRDLVRPAAGPSKTMSTASVSASARPASHVRAQPTEKIASTSSSNKTTPQTTITITTNEEDVDEDDDDIFTRFKNRTANARNRRRGVPRKEEKKTGAQESDDIIPSFI